MDILVLGGTAWLGREAATVAVARGHNVTCLARGGSGDVAPGAQLLAADRERPDAYDAICDVDFDAVIEVSWQPAFVRRALDALADRARHWLYVSSVSVYADTSRLDTDESAALLPAFTADAADQGHYGEAKLACELLSNDRIGDRLLVARSGLIGGPGDTSDRSGYWVARAARAPREDMLAPMEQECPTQLVDVRDLASWFIDAAEDKLVGTFNAVGESQPFSDWLSTSREVGAHTGEVVTVSTAWLAAEGVGHFAGPESIAVWLADPGSYGFAARRGDAARAAGLQCRPLRQTLSDVLTDERRRGLDRARKAGLSPGRERQLLALAAAGPSDDD